MGETVAVSDKVKTTRGQQKVRLGVVVSDRMQKTIVVRVEQFVRHPLYRRTIKRINSFKAHDEGNKAKTGDLVRIMETRPLSKDKRWRLIEVVRRSAQTDASNQEAL